MISLRPAAVAALLAMVPLAAAAQETSVALNNFEHDTSQPVEVTSNTLSVEDQAGVAVFEGDVVVIQGEMRMAAERVRVEYGTDGADTEISEMFATGGVTYTNGQDAAESQEAVYRPEEGDLVMTGDVVLTQGPSIMSGQRLVVDLDAGTGVMEGRVRTIFQSDGN